MIYLIVGADCARKFASDHSLQLLGEVIDGSNHFHVRHVSNKQHISKRSNFVRSWSKKGLELTKRLKKRSLQEGHHIEKRILNNSDISSAERQKAKPRTKRDFNSFDDENSGIRVNDPYWDKMWYLNRENDFTMNVVEAWKEGVTGRGVAVTILDDGIEKDHPDLMLNYDPLASSDINDNDSDPHPRYDFSDSNRHGTRCAGQVAASPNNSLCAIGIAYNAQIGGIRMLDGQVSDAVEARSLSFNPDHVDIYSSSWGPNDDGKTVDGPGKLATRAFKNGITRGRDGKGSIFVWASGNGGRYKDNCNCDGYATSIYTITVSSTSESGQIPWYSEACSSTLATTYSSGTTTEKQIVTTDLHYSCTVKHTGTSASAPMAAAIIALVLEAKPSLTWRDVQHIIVGTAKPRNLRATDWKPNGMNRSVSHSYGYGLMDSAAMVKTAKRWTLVPRQEKCLIQSPYYYKVIPAMGYVTIELDVDDCPGVRHLEHVVSPIHVSAGRKRGDLRIYLTSPAGTRSTLLDARPQDYMSSGFIDWPFMTTHSWGENPRGKWFLEIHNDAYSKWASDAKFFRWSLELYGIEFDPNSEEYKMAHKKDVNEEKFNVVREVSHFGSSGSIETQNNGLRHSISNVVQDDIINQDGGNSNKVKPGCISKRLECTQNVSDCRTFEHETVANLFCKCSQICSSVSRTNLATGNSGAHEIIYHMGCSFTSSKHRTQKQKGSGPNKASKVTSLVTKKAPFYCQFIPFFSY